MLNTPTVYIFVLVALFFIVFILNNKKNEDEKLERKGSGNSFDHSSGGEEIQEEENEFDRVDCDEFDKEFFERCQKGERRQLLCNFASWQDCSIYQGMLLSAGIPSHKEHEHINMVFFGSNLVSNVFAVQLWILVNDYEEAAVILKDFLEQKIKNFDEKAKIENTRKILRTLAGMLTAPYPVFKEHEILGVKIFPKSRQYE